VKTAPTDASGATTGSTASGAVHAPHAPLPEYYGAEQERTRWVRGLFDRTAADYDRVERAMSFGSGSWYRRKALERAGLKAGMRAVDVGCGTGLVTCEAVRLIGRPELVTGVDPSTGMRGSAVVPAGVELLAGSAETIPLPDATADFLSLGYALRHITDLTVAFTEFRRVLKPGGRLLILEIIRPANPLLRALLRLYLGVFVPLWCRLFARQAETPRLMRYYWDTIDACVTPAQVMSTLTALGFIDVSCHREGGMFAEIRARRPE